MCFSNRFSAALAFALLTSGCKPSGRAVVADVIYFGGPIVTVNDAQPAAEALALKDGKILDVGTRAEVEKAHNGKTTKTVDLAGKTLMPGFIDGHAHAQQFAESGDSLLNWISESNQGDSL